MLYFASGNGQEPLRQAVAPHVPQCGLAARRMIRLKRLMAVLLLCLWVAGSAAAEAPSGMLLLLTGAFYDEEGQVLVTARPARVELPEGARSDEYILVEDFEETYSLRADAYVAVPAELPIYEVRLLQSQAEDFPIYLNEFLRKMDQTKFELEPPEKGNGIFYRDYSLLYHAAVQAGEIASLTYCELPEGFAP